MSVQNIDLSKFGNERIFSYCWLYWMSRLCKLHPRIRALWRHLTLPKYPCQKAHLSSRFPTPYRWRVNSLVILKPVLWWYNQQNCLKCKNFSVNPSVLSYYNTIIVRKKHPQSREQQDINGKDEREEFRREGDPQETLMQIKPMVISPGRPNWGNTEVK